MVGRRGGFTLIEMLIVIVISGLIIGVGMRESPPLFNERAVGSASDAVLATSYRARSEAISAGRPMYVWILPNEGIVRMGTSPTELLDSVVMSDHNVTMTGNDLELCYTARGYAMPGCTTVTSPEEISFTRGDRSKSLTVLPLGQIWRDR